jgi:hypothetical protein
LTIAKPEEVSISPFKAKCLGLLEQVRKTREARGIAALVTPDKGCLN